MEALNTHIAKVILHSFKNSIKERRNVDLANLISFLNNPKYLNQKEDYLKTKINKKSVFELAKNLCIRLFFIDEENLSDQDEEATKENTFANKTFLSINLP